MRKALSAQKGFQGALVVRGDYASAPGMSGMCELSVRWRKTQTEIWIWNDEYGSECVEKLAESASAADLVRAITSNDLFAATVNPSRVTIRGDKPPMGRMLAMAWAAEFDTQEPAQLLALVPWSVLVRMARAGTEVDGKPMYRCLSRIRERLLRHDLTAGELTPLEEPLEATVDGVEKSLRREIIRTVRRLRSEERSRMAPLKPFSCAIDSILSQWSQDKPQRRYPSGGMLPPEGLTQMARYLRDYVVSNGELPVGVHTIPAGIDIFSNVGRAFTVDFDSLSP